MIAREWGITRQRFLKESTSDEFNDYVEILQMDWKKVEPIHYYLAQIAKTIFDIRFMFSKRKVTSKTEDFLIKFDLKENLSESERERRKRLQEPMPEDLTEEEKSSIVQRSKNFWTAILKVGGNKRHGRNS